ncbi:bacillithiol biosynthesis deacetylase BshB1 [Pullulanibacillus pueri]|nr:bacillithiol biosynthesis deacetylase BshB1 [Pullulanibacillus pueri]
MVESLDLLAFGAHPDDVEIGMGGTIAKHISLKKAVGIIDLTKAELSSNGDVVTRQQEAKEASEILGLTVRQSFDIPDRGIEMNHETISLIVDSIRRYRPSVVFAPYFIDRHPDHGHCGRLVEEAVFSAGIRKYKGMQDLPSHKVEALYFYFINGFHTPSFCVDITQVHEQKMRALSAYKSQFILSEESVETPLTTDYLETVESRDRLFGKEIGTRYAEGFISKKPLVISSFI